MVNFSLYLNVERMEGNCYIKGIQSVKPEAELLEGLGNLTAAQLFKTLHLKRLAMAE